MTSSRPALPALTLLLNQRFFLKVIKFVCLCHPSPQFPLDTSASMWGPGGLQDVQDILSSIPSESVYGGFQPPFLNCNTEYDQHPFSLYVRRLILQGIFMRVKL